MLPKVNFKAYFGIFSMLLKGLILSIIIFLLGPGSIQAYEQQKIKDFYLSNFNDDGSRDWEVEGKEAVIYDEHIDISEMEANYYLKEDTILITSDQARLNKNNMDVYLQDNVHIENKEGTTLDTDSLNWQRTQNVVETDDRVKTIRDSMQIEGDGLFADTQLKKANFKKNVEVVLPDKKSEEITTATCSGPLEIEYDAGKAIFNQDVVVTNPQGKLYSDKATLFFNTESKEITKIISEGNVKIIRGNNVTFSQKASYFSKEQKIVLEGRPRVIYYPDSGESMNLFK
ncbi:MAG: LPS export ABC transporter periplasmic protein LptC [Candidatus Omnitrophota bacterium]